jgi:uncharacterized protein (TIGR02271 family)
MSSHPSNEHHLFGIHAEHSDREARREESGATVQLREEELLARKQTVQSGQVTVGTDVVTEQQTLEVPVTREEVVIDRHAVNRRPSDEPISATSETITVPVREEQVTAEKRAVVYEEVTVGKQSVQQMDRVSDTVRKEVVDVDARGDLDVANQSDRLRSRPE